MPKKKTRVTEPFKSKFSSVFLNTTNVNNVLNNVPRNEFEGKLKKFTENKKSKR